MLGCATCGACSPAKAVSWVHTGDTLEARLTAQRELTIKFLVPLDPTPMWAFGDPTGGAVWLGDLGFDWDREVRDQATERLRPLLQRLFNGGVWVAGTPQE